MAWRLARNFGSRIERLLDGADGLADPGEHFGADLYASELRYLVQHAWATDAEDVLWRRSELGLVLDVDAATRVGQWMNACMAPGSREATA